MKASEYRPAHKGYPRGGAMDRVMGYDVAAALIVHGRYPALCRCVRVCGDDGDVDGPGTCKGLPRAPAPPLVEVVMVRR